MPRFRVTTDCRLPALTIEASLTDPISLSVATLSLAVSAATAWFTLLRRGRVLLSRPMSVYFGPDNYGNRRSSPKIYIRALVFCTAKRGRVIESIYASLRNGEMRQNFSIWVYGVHGKFVRGSGLFVGEDGASFDHHFLTPPENKDFIFRAGIYQLEIYIRLLGDKNERKVFGGDFSLSHELATAMNEREVGVYFDWGPDSQRYWPHLDEGPPPSPDADALIKALGAKAKISE